jgi:hypothetical protein
MKGEIDPVSETSCFLFSKIPDDGESPKTQQFCVRNLSNQGLGVNEEIKAFIEQNVILLLDMGKFA